MHVYFKVRYFSSCLLCLVLCLGLSGAYAQENIQATLQSESDHNNTFKIEQANQTFDEISIRLATENLEIGNIQRSIDVLLGLEAQVKDCYRSAEADLKMTTEQLKKIPVQNQLTREIQYLEDKKNAYGHRATQCRLLALRTKGLVTALRKTVQQLETSELFKREAPFWENISETPELIQSFFRDFNVNNVLEQFKIKDFNQLLMIVFLLLLILAGMFSFRFKAFISQFISTKRSDSVSTLIKQSLLAELVRHHLSLFVSIAIFIFFSVFCFLDYFPRVYLLMSAANLGIMLYLMTGEFLFYPPKPAHRFHRLPAALTKILVFRLKSLSVVAFLGVIAYLLCHEQPYPEATINLIRTTFMTILSINIISVIWLINRLPRLVEAHPILRLLIGFLLSTTLLGILSVEWLGYYQLSTFLLVSLSYSVGLCIFAWFLHKLLISIVDSLEGEESRWQRWLHYQMGKKTHTTLPELLWLRLVIYALIWGGLVIYLLQIWEFPQTQYYALMDAIFKGFKIAEVLIVPAHILIGMFLFSVLLGVTRWLKYRVVKNRRIRRNQGEQEALATMVGYIGFSAALLVSLLIAGVSLTGLAFVAGALSVGIGFGLQSIVHNFVSGLILLIERPVKVGDRIIVGGIEGFVRQISIRSTQINTLERTDIIVPNSEMISGQVTSFMFRDHTFRITVKVGVNYGSDIELVKKTLTEIAQAHPKVMKDEANTPSVFFMGFGDNSLNFEMWCYISDVNLKLFVLTDLNFSVDLIFKERGIGIAFPQRDLHIKEWPGSYPKS